MSYQTKTAVAVVIFNREEKAQKLYSIIKEVKPQKLFVIADGPRNEQEKGKCEAARAVFEKIEWDCEVLRNYSNVNLGCCKRPYTGFDWVFSQTEQAILLEDDCIPSIDFFRFCDEMLEKYKDDTRIMQVCGTNLLQKWDCKGDSYFFAQWASCWGWASWARAWKLYDINMEAWKEPRVRDLVEQRLGKRIFKIRSKTFDKHCGYREDLTAWDHQWSFIRTINSGLSVTPAVNLVTNIGSGEDATHTNDMSENSLEAIKMEFPLIHPGCVLPDTEFDLKMAERVYNAKPMYKKIIPKIKRITKKLFGMIFRK